MLRFVPLALAVLLLTCAPALAQTDDMGSEAQTEGYGRLFGYVGIVVAAVIILLVIHHVIKSMIAEASRGQRIAQITDILDDLPKQKRVLYLGEKVPDWKVGNRIEATEAALRLLAKKDDWFDPKYLRNLVEGAFKAYKAAVQLKTSKKVADRLGDRPLEELVDEIKKLRKRTEIHVYGKAEVLSVDIVHVEAPKSKDKHTFAALVQARSQDFFMDEKTKEVKRGDKKVYLYQEFLCFRRTAERWIVDRIRPSGDMDFVLNVKNLLAPADMAAYTKTASEDHLREFAKPDPLT